MQPTGFQDYAQQTHRRHFQEGALPDPERPMEALEAAATFFREYARERPEVVALWTFGIGFVVGWKLKPW